MKDILFLIPARSGSKGVKDKNIKKLFGIPLLAIRGLSALSITEKENVWLSTDSDTYAKVGTEYGLSVPFMRPEYLSNDKASSMDVVLHAMQYAESIGRKYEMIALLEPTSPFIYRENLLDAIITLRTDNEASSIVATKKVETASIFIQEDRKYLDILSANLIKAKSYRRQDFLSEVTPSGGFYISKWNDFIVNKTFYTDKTLSYVLPDECSLEIDHILQFHWAEFLVEKEIIDINKIYENGII